MRDSLGERLIRAAAAQDFVGAGSLLAPDVEFRALTPQKLFEAHARETVIQVLEDWYSPAEAIEALEAETVIDRPGVRYRIRWSSDAEGRFVFEQQAYYDVVDGQITRIHLVCSGDRPIDGAGGVGAVSAG